MVVLEIGQKWERDTRHGVEVAKVVSILKTRVRLVLWDGYVLTVPYGRRGISGWRLSHGG